MENEIGFNFGIPFKVSKYTKALELCIYSIEKFCPHKCIYILLDYSDEKLLEGFNLDNLMALSNNIIIKRYVANRGGDYKQALLNWVLNDGYYDYSIILHSDVYFYNSYIIEKFYRSLRANPTVGFAGWKTPLVFYQSKYHEDASKKRQFWVAPRVCTWLFAINNCVFSNIDEYDILLKGHYWCDKSFNAVIPIRDADNFWDWLKNEFVKNNFNADEKILLDIGTFLRYKLDKQDLKALIFGEKSNPSFDSLELIYQPEGYVHIEQYDPERFNGSLYSESLMEYRTQLVQAELEKIKKGII